MAALEQKSAGRLANQGHQLFWPPRLEQEALGQPTVDRFDRLFHAVHAGHQDADGPGRVFPAPFEERDALQPWELLVADDDVYILSGEQELSLFGRLGAAQVVVGRQQPAGQLSQGRFVIHEQDRALESGHDWYPRYPETSENNPHSPPAMNPLPVA